MKKIAFISTLCILFFSGCSSKEKTPSYDVPPTKQQQNSKEALKNI